MKNMWFLMLWLVCLGGCSKDDDGDDSLKPGSDFTETVNGVSFDMVYVKGGTFNMGATEEQGSDAYPWEKPIHSVTLSDYYIGKFEVTQGLWEAVMGSNPSYNVKGDDYPVEQVIRDDIQEFLDRLNKLTGKNYQLPTEAQWEYAARGGAKSKGYKYSGSNTIDCVAWYNTGDIETRHTHPVGKKQPNELGIYDMSGNVEEFCADLVSYYSDDSQTDPTGPATGNGHVQRGGSFSNDAKLCRVSYRNLFYGDNNVSGSFGFRVVLLP